MMKIKQKNTLTKQKNSQKGNAGITLIALVVTIIVLLILARNLDLNANRTKSEY